MESSVTKDPNERLTAKAARDEFPESKTQQTLSNYIHRGVLNKHTGERIFLAYNVEGGQIRVTRKSVHEFIAALNRRG